MPSDLAVRGSWPDAASRQVRGTRTSPSPDRNADAAAFRIGRATTKINHFSTDTPQFVSEMPGHAYRSGWD